MTLYFIANAVYFVDIPVYMTATSILQVYQAK